MSGSMRDINQRKRHGKMSCSGNLVTWRESNKKAKLLIADLSRLGGCNTCGQIPR